MKESESISHDDYAMLNKSIQEEKDVLKYWDGIKIKSFSTDIEQQGRLTKGSHVDVSCAIQPGQASTELFCVELFYMLDNNSRFKIIPMEVKDKASSTANYTCSLEVEGYGLQCRICTPNLSNGPNENS